MEEMSEEVKIEAGDRYQNTLLGLDTPCNEEATAATNLTSPGSTSSFRSISSKQRWNESPEARARRLARNAERMRERRARETDEEYRRRLARNAEANRTRRQNESEVERAMRLVRNAARQRLRRAMESTEQRAKRLAKLAERMRIYRANETPEQRKERLTEMAARARERISRESSEERRERLRKLSEYAKKVRSSKNNIKNVNSNINLNQNSNLGTVNSVQPSQNPQVQGLAQHHQPEGQHNQQQSEQAYPQNITNSIEYYQNMFIHTALRPNMTKEQINAQQAEPSLRFMPSNMPMEANTSPNLFQQGQYDSAKIPKYQNIQNQTLTNTIEYYQNKFIKAEKPPETQGDKNVISLQQNFEHKNINCDKKRPDPNYSVHQHVQGPHTPLYNQFPYLNTFPPSHAPSNVNNQQNYYPMYHNGFQLAITPNSAPPPFTPVHFQNSGVQSPTHPYTLLSSSPQNQVVTDFPKTVRERFKKEFSESELSRLPSDLPNETIRQQKVAFLENEINQVLSSPKRSRGRPGRCQETEEERRVRLDKMAAHQRRVRANETSEERAARLKSLSERARLKRAQVRATESQDQRRQRLAKQAEYARLRRLKAQTPEHKRRMEEKAKELYAQLHNLPLPQQQTNMNQQMTAQSGATSDDFVKNPEKDFAQSENNDVLKILEPIIVMKAK